MFMKNIFLTIILMGAFSASLAKANTGKYFDRAIFVIFENTNYADVMRQPFFKQLADRGTNFTNFMALTHPSQGNYIALTSGSLNGVGGDGNYDLNIRNVVDLLEAKGLTWKVYAEGYPGHCFTGTSSGNYVRKHNPFISYVDIQKNPVRCANIVEASEFDLDMANGTLPNYIFYVPDMNNDAHETNVAYADKWYQQRFSPFLNNSQLMADTVLITTFDESGSIFSKNQIYTSIVGAKVKHIVVSDTLNTNSLLSLIEQNWNLGDLGKQDATATPIPDIWQ
jgi:phospholipase C